MISIVLHICFIFQVVYSCYIRQSPAPCCCEQGLLARAQRKGGSELGWDAGAPTSWLGAPNVSLCLLSHVLFSILVSSRQSCFCGSAPQLIVESWISITNTLCFLSLTLSSSYFYFCSFCFPHQLILLLLYSISVPMDFSVVTAQLLSLCLLHSRMPFQSGFPFINFSSFYLFLMLALNSFHSVSYTLILICSNLIFYFSFPNRARLLL